MSCKCKNTETWISLNSFGRIWWPSKGPLYVSLTTKKLRTTQYSPGWQASGHSSNRGGHLGSPTQPLAGGCGTRPPTWSSWPWTLVQPFCSLLPLLGLPFKLFLVLLVLLLMLPLQVGSGIPEIFQGEAEAISVRPPSNSVAVSRPSRTLCWSHPC